MITPCVSPFHRSWLAAAGPAALLARVADRARGFVYRRRPDAAWTMDFISDGCRDVTGFEAGRFVNDGGLSFAQLIHPADRDRVAHEIAVAIERRRRRTLRYRIRAAHEGIVWVEDRALPVFDGHGSLIAIEGLIDRLPGDPLTDGNASEEAFADFFRRNPVPMVLSRGNGIVWAINAAFVQRFAFSSEELLVPYGLNDLLRHLARRVGADAGLRDRDAAAVLGATSVPMAMVGGPNTVLTILPRPERLRQTLWWRGARPRRARRRMRASNVADGSYGTEGSHRSYGACRLAGAAGHSHGGVCKTGALQGP